MTISASLLGLFAVTGSGLVAFTYKKTAPAIAAAERNNLLKKLHSVVAKDQHDNDLFNDFILVTSELLGTDTAMPIFRARKGNTNVAAIINANAPDGYNGDIRILIGIYANGNIAGVRVLSHRETPGLGDAIEERRSNWVYGFDGLSLSNPSKTKWKVRRDGGHFDQFTGATITPRAVVKAVHKALQYFEGNKDQIFDQASLMPESQTEPAPADQETP